MLSKMKEGHKLSESPADQVQRGWDRMNPELDLSAEVGLDCHKHAFQEHKEDLLPMTIYSDISQ